MFDKHVPMKKSTVKSRPALWLTECLKDLMKKRDEAKSTVAKSGSVEDTLKYCQLRNQVTKLSKKMKKEYHKKE